MNSLVPRGASRGLHERISSRDGEPLTDYDLRKAVPSIYATEAHESRSQKYAYVPTAEILSALRKEGFEPFSASQSRSRDVTKREFTKHMIRLRTPHAPRNKNGLQAEAILINSHDGSSRYHLLGGFIRFICSNGLICADSIINGIHIPHKGDVTHDVIEGVFSVVEGLKKAEEHTEAWSQLQLSREERQLLAETAHEIRFPKVEAEEGEFTPATPIRPQQLLVPKRYEDSKPDLWTTFNVLQENIIKGGASAVRPAWRDNEGKLHQARRSRMREVAGIDQNVKLNQALWTMAEKFAALKQAA